VPPQEPRRTMWRRLSLALIRPCRRVWRQGTSRVRGLLARTTADRSLTEDDFRQAEARARFWSELREGQREAAHSATRNP
jgi:hypothetical protein